MIDSTLGHYRITDRLGAGGMGEVYRAEDTTLSRDVAIKVLPQDFAADPERLARFEREAKLLAALNHPNIAQVYGFEEQAGTRFLVLELVEGEDLSECLSRGPLPVDEAIEIARQIAEALEEAHEKGIVHRDLKPANVKVTPDGKVKVLDFGLAKAWAGDVAGGSGSSVDISQSPTLAHTGTQAGVILGTAAYMSPEQARGKPVDKRADIWAFGVVLFEMLTGKRLFTGETVSDVLAAVLTRDVAWNELPARLPPKLRRLLERCLERDPRQRLRDMGEARIALGRTDAGSEGPVAKPVLRRPLLFAVIGVVAGIALASLVPRGQRRTAAQPRPAVHFTVDAKVGIPPTVAISRDGSSLAFSQRKRGMLSTLWLQRLDEEKPTEFPDVVGPADCFWSPDGRRLAVSTRSDFLILDARTGAPQRSLDRSSLGVPRGGTWSSQGAILLGANGSIVRLQEDSAPPLPILVPREGEHSWHGWPSFLPDGDRFLFTSAVQEGGEEIHVVQVASLASPEHSRVLARRAFAGFWSNGYLIYATAAEELYAQPLDPETLTLTGEPRLLAQDVDIDSRFAAVAAAGSESGTVVYRRRTKPSRRFVWLDAAGRSLGEASEPGPWHNFALSPDGTTIATTDTGRADGNHLWLIEPARGVATEVSAPGDPSISDPTWSPDGRHLAFRMGESLVIRPARGGDGSVLLDRRGYPDSWSRDGRWLLYGQADRGTYGLLARDVTDPTAEAIHLVSGPRNADEPRFSPDGKWIAYHATGSSLGTEVYAIPFPPTGERWQISNAGGAQPRWSPAGEALFYLDFEGRLMRVAIPGSDPRRAGTPEVLFEARLETSSSFDQFDVAPDGRLLFQLPAEGTEAAAPVHVLIGWEQKAGGQ